jgi:hypothetical protein
VSFLLLPVLVVVLVLPEITTAALTCPVEGPLHAVLAALPAARTGANDTEDPEVEVVDLREAGSTTSLRST